MRIHTSKRAIRAMGVAESFRDGDERSILAGVVMRADLVVDGFVFGAATVGGQDATAKVLRMYRKLHRNDVNLIMLSGCIISRYNIVDVDLLSRSAGVPVLCLTYRESAGIEGAIRHHFGDGAVERVEQYRRLGGREEASLRTGKRVYVRRSGMTLQEAGKVLDAFTLQGSVAEPVRLAKLLARARARRS